MQVAEAEVFEFSLEPANPQTVGNGSVDVERLLCDRLLLQWRQMLQRHHVVEAIRQLDEDYANVLRHGHDHLAEVLGLLLLRRLEGHLTELRDSVDEVRHILAELSLNLLERRGCVLDRVV